MKNLSVKYLGLTLSSPVVVSSSPFTSSVDRIISIEKMGAGAVVLKSVFQEQVISDAASIEKYSDYPEATDYIRSYLGNEYLNNYLDMIAECKRKVKIPIIASINCMSADEWVDYALRIEDAGADALELNIFIMPTDASRSSEEIEQDYLKTISLITNTVKIPVSVKLSIRFTNIFSVARQIYNHKGAGVVMYNRYFEPDIDIERMTLVSSDTMSSPVELRNALRSVAICSSVVPQIDISVSTGVYNGEDAVKSILAGAKTVQICSTIYEHGLGIIEEINRFIDAWMDTNSFDSIEAFCGKMNYKDSQATDMYQRVQFIKYHPKD